MPKCFPARPYLADCMAQFKWSDKATAYSEQGYSVNVYFSWRLLGESNDRSSKSNLLLENHDAYLGNVSNTYMHSASFRTSVTLNRSPFYRHETVNGSYDKSLYSISLKYCLHVSTARTCSILHSEIDRVYRMADVFTCVTAQNVVYALDKRYVYDTVTIFLKWKNNSQWV